jgi:K+-sensing histidine kinase KdpD
MASISSFRSPRLRADSVALPRVRLVDRTPVQSPKTSVIACLTARGSSNGELLRKAHMAACERSGKLYAVFVDSPRARFARAQVRTLVDDAILADRLGAKIIWLESSDSAGGLLQLARQSHVGRVFISRGRSPLFPWFKRDVYSDLLRRSEGLRIDVVGLRGGID